MLLAIDAGNTNIVFALIGDEGDIRHSWRCATDTRKTADEYAVWLGQLMELAGLTPQDVTATLISSVVPGADMNLARLCRDYFGCDARFIGGEGIDAGIGLLVDTPGEVGSDRLVNAVAAADAYSVPLIVVDFGTATTFDVVNADGDYCGGVIAPGINLSVEALSNAAARLPRIDIGAPEKVVGTNTLGAMQSGIYWGYISMVEGIISRIQAETGASMQVVATGGLAPLLADGAEVIDYVDPDLTLRGLYLIHKRNS